jgi:pyruvate/2-oxoglutarate dehydrogenase complex dihydrolipoamide dehydrogenase (E3) component
MARGRSRARVLPQTPTVRKPLGVLVGATSTGPAGAEVLGLLALAVHARVPIAELRSMIYAYPTFHRGVEDALNDLVAS